MAKDQDITAHRDAFVRRVRQARKGRFGTQQELCDVLDIPQPKYDKYERRSYLPLYLIWRFCQACGVELKWLVTGRGRVQLRQITEQQEAPPAPITRRRKASRVA